MIKNFFNFIKLRYDHLLNKTPYEIYQQLKKIFLFTSISIALTHHIYFLIKDISQVFLLNNFLIHLISFSILFLLSILLTKKNKINFVSRIFVIFLFFIVFYFIFFSQLSSSKMAIIYLFPLISYLLLKFKEGFLYSSILLFIIVFSENIHNFGLSKIDKNLKVSFILTYFSIYFTMSIFRFFIDLFQKKVIQNEEMLTYENKVLLSLKEVFYQKTKEFEDLFSIVPEGIFITDKEKKIVKINKRALDIIGYKENNIIGKKCSLFTLEPCKKECEIFHKSDDIPLYNKICSIITASGDIRIISKNAQILKDENKNIIGSIEVFEDITEKYNYELENKKLLFSVEQSPASIVITDIDGNIEYINKKFTEVSGYTFEEVKGKNPRILKSGYKTSQEYKELWDTIKSGKEWRGEFHNKRKDGRLYWELALIAPIMDEKGNVLNFVGVKEDISERKKIEMELQEEKLKAEEATKAKSIFLANMSHEIRTPLNGIIGMIDLLSGTKLTNEQKDYVTTIKQSSITLLTIINDILDFSKIESGKMTFEEVEFDLYELIEISLRQFQFDISRKGLELLVDIEKDVPRYVKSDPTRLKQVLTNLIGNSIKFTQKGEILLEVKLEKKDENELTLKFIVSDSGIGLDKDKIDKIFLPFEQADGSINRRFGGTGLGTTISKYIVERLGGKIYATSPSKLSKEDGRGKGGEFGFEIKCFEFSNDDIKEFNYKSLNLKKVLVIDDNEMNLKIMNKMLSLWSIDSQCIKSFLSFDGNSEEFDLIFIDYLMPDIDGLNVAKLIKEKNKTSKIVIVSSINLKTEKEELKNIDGYLQKPVTQSSLYDLLVNLYFSTVSKNEEDKNDSVSKQIQPKGYNILLAEDNLVNQKVAKYMMNRLGYEIDIASNGNEVLQKMSQKSYDLILMDVQMPEMDGLTTTRIIREVEDDLKNGKKGSYNLVFNKIPVPIIALTANAMQEDKTVCLANGMDDFISKPLNLNDLKSIVEKYLP